MPDVLHSEILRMAGFAHGFSLRPLDLSLDAPDYARALARFAEAAGFAADRVRQAEQVHGSVVVDASDVRPDAPAGDRVRADALVAFSAGLAPGVRVADCVPILIGDPESGAVAAVHAGWRGFVAGVLPNAIAALRLRTPDFVASRLVAAIGPCIGPCCFEVGADVGREIERAAASSVARPGASPDKAMVDLAAGVRAQLIAAGLTDQSIDRVGGCTRCDRERFFSYRRGSDDGGPERRRMLAAIAARQS